MATNRADTLDPALLRPGRLDRKIEFPLPDRRQKRLIFSTITSKMNLSEEVDLEDCILFFHLHHVGGVFSCACAASLCVCIENLIFLPVVFIYLIFYRTSPLCYDFLVFQLLSSLKFNLRLALSFFAVLRSIFCDWTHLVQCTVLCPLINVHIIYGLKHFLYWCPFYKNRKDRFHDIFYDILVTSLIHPNVAMLFICKRATVRPSFGILFLSSLTDVQMWPDQTRFLEPISTPSARRWAGACVFFINKFILVGLLTEWLSFF